MKKLGMVVAVETGAFKKKYKDNLKLENKDAGFEVFSVDFNDKILYIAIAGVGEIRAAACAQLLISKYEVELMINYGVVGSLNKDLNLIETCVVSRVVHYDRDTSFLDHCEVGRYMEYESVYLPTTSSYVELVTKLNTNIKEVTCASGEKFVEGEEEKQKLHDTFNADICDMESAAIVLVSDANKVPVVMIKTISDSIKGGAQEYGQNLELAADKCLELIDQIIKQY